MSPKLGWLCAMVLLMSSIGCAIGNKHDYETQAPDLGVMTTRTVALTTYDQRPLVVKEEETEAYVGYQRGGYGNPFVVKTEGNKPFAAVVSGVVTRSLEKGGARVTPVTVTFKSKPDEIMSALRATKADRLVLITAEEWDSNTYVNTDLDYAFALDVYDADGKTLAHREIKQKDTIDGSSWNPPAAAKKNIPPAFRDRLERLFRDPAVAAALR